MPDQRQILELLVSARQALNGVARFNPEGNIYHDDEGHFTGTGGHTGRKPKPPNKGRKPGQPTAQEARRQQLEEHRKEGHARIAEQRKEHAGARKDLVKDHKGEWNDLKKGHAKADKELARDQAKELRELDRDHAKDHRELDREHDKERKADAKDEDADDDDRKHREQTRKDDKDNLTEEHGHARKSVEEEHAQQVKEHAEDHDQERKDKLAEFAEARKDLLEEHKQERHELLEEFKEELKDEGFKKKSPKVRGSTATTTSSTEKHGEALKAMFGRIPSTQELGNLGGIGDGKFVFFKDHEGSIYVSGGNDKYEVNRIIGKDQDGKTYLNAVNFNVKEGSRGQGIGASVFGRMVEQAKASGIDYIKCEAGREKGQNGYAIWPKMGYDGDIPKEVKSKLPSEMSDSKRVSDLMKTPEGRKFWEENGVTTNMTFDLKSGSQSNKIWSDYQKNKKTK